MVLTRMAVLSCDMYIISCETHATRNGINSWTFLLEFIRSRTLPFRSKNPFIHNVLNFYGLSICNHANVKTWRAKIFSEGNPSRSFSRQHFFNIFAQVILWFLNVDCVFLSQSALPYCVKLILLLLHPLMTNLTLWMLLQKFFRHTSVRE